MKVKMRKLLKKHGRKLLKEVLREVTYEEKVCHELAFFTFFSLLFLSY